MNKLRGRLIIIVNESAPAFREDQSLLQQVDSLALLQLVTRIETEFRIQIAAMELPAAFASLAALEDLIRRKTGDN